MAQTSALTTFRRAGGKLCSPVELCQRMDGRVGVFSRCEVSVKSSSKKRSYSPIPLLSLPINCALTGGHRHSFAPAPHTWSHVAALASSVNAPWYFEVAGESDETADEQQQQLSRASFLLRERKWVESATAIYIASCLVRSRQQQSPVSDLERFVAWTYCEQNHQMMSPLNSSAASIEEVHARFRVFQMRALLESCLLDAITTAPPRTAELLFGPAVKTPVLLTDPITRAVEIATSGAVFDDVVVASSRRRSFFAPFLSSVASAVTEHEAPNCQITLRQNRLVLELTRSVRAGEELLK